MSANYALRSLIGCGTITPSSAGTEFAGGGGAQDYLVHGIDATVITAGTESAHECNLQTFDGATELASLEIGTSAAGTYLVAKVAAGSRKRTSGSEWRVQSVTDDATAKYSYRVWGSPAV